MFINLIDNAIKYTNKGSITIESFVNSYGNIQADITDTGIGISSAYLNKILILSSKKNKVTQDLTKVLDLVYL